MSVNEEKDIEQIKQEKILERLEKLEEEKKNSKTEIKKLKTNKNIEREGQDKEKGMNRREFLKKAGLGTIGLGAMSLLPGSALEVRDSDGFQIYDGTDTGTEALDVNVGGPVELKNTNFSVGSNKVKTDNFEFTENSSTNSLDFNYTG